MKRMSQVGRTVADRYVLESIAGSGGMGTVYRARDLTNGRTLALKLLRAGLGDPVRFAREAAALSKVQHAGVVQYVDHGYTTDEEPYLVMEWLDGIDLQQRLARGPLAVAEVRALASRLATILGALHELGIVHRDIKPGNLFLENNDLDRLKVLDLGIARVRAGSFTATGTGAILGTPAYMAPEQARGESNVDARVDLFATGCVLYEYLAGRPPFVGDGPMAVLAKVLLEQPPPLRELRTDTPRALAQLIARLMAKDAAERPPNGRALLAAIEAADRDESAGDRETPLPAISAAELRVVSVVFAAPIEATAPTVLRADPDQLGPRGPIETKPTPGERRASMAASATGAQIVRLANGGMVAAYASAGSPKDLAHRAAVCALDWSTSLEGRAVAVSTGRAALIARQPVGDAIDRAAALVRTARNAEVVVDETTRSLLEDSFTVRREPRGDVLVGPLDAEPVRELLGKPMPCVGRERELALLSSIFDECVGELTPRAALVIAPAGTGKTRVVHELVRSLRLRHPDTVVATARLDALAAGSPYALASRLVRQLAKMDAVAPADRWRALETAIARRLPKGARRVAGFVAEIVGADPGSELDPAVAAARRDPGLMADGMRDAILDWLRAECARAPHILAIEDLHWGDAPSVRLVDAMLDRLRESPLFVLATARPEVQDVFPSLWSDRGVQELRLGTLNRRACARLVRGAIPDCDDELVESLARRTAGHPFFLEELIRAVAAGASPDVLPDSVLGMLQARLDALGEDAKRVLRAASVFGQMFREEAVRALVPEHVGTGVLLEQLVAKEIVERASQVADIRGAAFAFRHALVRDAAYATLPDADRTLAHALAGRWLEHAGEADATALADHFVRGGIADRAIHWLARAAQQALEASDFAGCLAAVSRARALSPDATAAAALDLVAAEATYWRDGPLEATPLATRAYETLVPESLPWFRATNVLVNCHGQRGDNDAVERIARRAAAATATTDTRQELAGVLARTIYQLVWACRDTRELVARLDEVAPNPESLDPSIAALALRAKGATLVRDHYDMDRGMRTLAASAEAFDRTNARRDAVMLRGVTYAHEAMLGDPMANTRLAALFAAYDDDTTYVASFLRMSVALGLVVWKRPEEALHVLADAVPRLRGSTRVELLGRFLRAWSLLQLGRFGEALAESEAASAIEAGGAIRARPMAIAALASLALGRTDDAAAHARRALDHIAGFEGWENYEGLVELGAARVFAATGDVAAARAVIAPAIERIDRVANGLPPDRAALVWKLPLPNAELRAFAAELGV